MRTTAFTKRYLGSLNRSEQVKQVAQLQCKPEDSYQSQVLRTGTEAFGMIPVHLGLLLVKANHFQLTNADQNHLA